MLLPLALFLLCVFALIGLVVGVFFSTIVCQRVLQRHVHLLQMRSAAQRFVVVDRSRGLGAATSSSSSRICSSRSETRTEMQPMQLHRAQTMQRGAERSV